MMKLIQCKLGTTEVVVGGHAYNFQRDKHGRAVARVDDLIHRSCFLNVEHYIEADDIPDEPEAVNQEPAPSDISGIPSNEQTVQVDEPVLAPEPEPEQEPVAEPETALSNDAPGIVDPDEVAVADEPEAAIADVEEPASDESSEQTEGETASAPAEVRRRGRRRG